MEKPIKKPHILYWKWNDEMLDIEKVRAKTQDIINRSIFDVIYIALHSMAEENQVMHSEKTCEMLAECSKILRENGRKLVLDLNIKSETAYLKAHPLKEQDVMVRYMEDTLDENGVLTVNVPDSDGLFLAKCAETLENITQKASVDGENITFDLGITYANQRIIFFPKRNYFGYDICGDEYKKHREIMFEKAEKIGLSGAATDEWGHNIKVEIEAENVERTENQMDYMAKLRETIDLDTAPFVAKWFHVSDGLIKYYKEYHGRNLKEDLVYFRSSEEIVNLYINTVRRRIVDGDHTFYDCVKRHFGEDAYVMCHPTWWGDELDSNFESIRNGLDWWEVKRDFSQTDEQILFPVRLSMARKCKDNLWYNMWYSMRTLDLKTYFRETWVNARYGGRTHYLGYECYEPGVVLTLYQEGRLEAVSNMEKEIEKLNQVQTSRPDSKVLIIFGYEAVSNWNISEPGETQWKRIAPIFHNTWKFAKTLFCAHHLCEIVPSYEIDNGNVTVENGKITYCGHSYDAAVVLYPVGISEKSKTLIAEYSTQGVLAILGDKRKEFDNVNAFKVQEPNASQVSAWLDENKIPRNCGENYCIYEDGSVVFTTDGKEHVGNELKVDTEINGHHIHFDGEDFLYVNFGSGEVSYVKKTELMIEKR